MWEIITIITGGLRRLIGGGWILIPLAFYSLFAHAIIINRALALRKNKLIPSPFIAEIYRALTRGGADIAVNLCNRKPGPLTNVMKAGITHRDYDEKRLRLVVKFALGDEKSGVERYLDMLGMLPTVAMSTGLLGTVIGMIKSFGSLYESPQGVAIGISEALITTASGLLVALPTYVAHNYFTAKTDNLLKVIERHSISLVRFLTTGEYKLFQEEETLDFQDLEAIRRERET